MKTLAERCFEYRVAHDLSQQEMAKLCRVHWLTINNCENGKTVSKMTAAKIMAVIGQEG